jgi:hypothetical protein
LVYLDERVRVAVTDAAVACVLDLLVVALIVLDARLVKVSNRQLVDWTHLQMGHHFKIELVFVVGSN